MKNNRKKWSGKSRGGEFGLRFFVFLIKTFGVRVAYGFLSLVVIYFIPFAPKATAAVWDYYRITHNYSVIRSLKWLYLHYYRFGQTMIDKIAIQSGMEDSFSFEFENYERFLDVLSTTNGVVLIGAHVGCWEVGANFFGDYAQRLNLVMYDAEYRKIKKVMDENCIKAGYKVIAINEGGIESVVIMKKALDSGQYLCFQGDRYLNVDHLIDTEFLGRAAIFPEGPFIVAQRFGTPVVFYYAMREKGGKYRFIFDIAHSKSPVFDQYRDSLERVVQQYPEQWFNFYKFWL